MKSFTFLLSVAYSATLAIAATAPKCNSDNCARAVTGTQKGPAFQTSAKKDCSSFLKATVYPSTVTSTVTATAFPVTSTSTIITTGTTIFKTVTFSTATVQASTETDTTTVGTATVTVNQKRAAATTGTVKPSSVPSYASACSGTVRYSSACSCFGVTPTTTTMATPTTYTTITISKTAGTTVISSVTATSTQSNVLTTSVTTTVTASVSATATATVAPVSAVCANGQPPSSQICTNQPCVSFNLRIEGGSDTVYEGIINTGPRTVTTPSGGTHACDGTNNGANSVAAGNGISSIADASEACGFTFDGSFSNQFDDFFITRIGTSDSNTSPGQYWGILTDFTFTPAGGCETEPGPGGDLLWAFNAFNVNYFLDIAPRTATLTVGQSQVFTVTGHDGNGGGAVPIAGAVFNGQVSNSAGQVTFTATVPGTYRLKATRSDSIRSPAVVITVTA